MSMQAELQWAAVCTWSALARSETISSAMSLAIHHVHLHHLWAVALRLPWQCSMHRQPGMHCGVQRAMTRGEIWQLLTL